MCLQEREREANRSKADGPELGGGRGGRGRGGGKKAGGRGGKKK